MRDMTLEKGPFSLDFSLAQLHFSTFFESFILSQPPGNHGHCSAKVAVCKNAEKLSFF